MSSLIRLIVLSFGLLIEISARELKSVAEPDQQTVANPGQVADSIVSDETVVQPLAQTQSEVAWMVTAIIFIVLFALAISLVIYLWHLRNAKIKELRALQTTRNDKNSRNVWYGGSYM